MDKNNEEWNHLKYFILIDFGLAYKDLSINVFVDDIDHVRTTFYGSPLNHLTIRSLKAGSNEMYVTLHSLGRNGLFT